jgi:hypothetical protein
MTPTLIARGQTTIATMTMGQGMKIDDKEDDDKDNHYKATTTQQQGWRQRCTTTQPKWWWHMTRGTMRMGQELKVQAMDTVPYGEHKTWPKRHHQCFLGCR